MDFLSPAWLGLAGAAAVPLLLHLLRRRIGTRVEFPAARLLARAEQEASARLRLRNLLLMALRVLALVLVALAAARPLADLPGTTRGPAAVAIVLDNSLSAGAVVAGRPVLEVLRDAARATLDAAGAQDRVWLVTVDGAVTGGSRDAVRAALGRTTLWPGRGDLPGAVTRAALLAGGAGTQAASVVVLTDGQAAAWPRSPSVGRVPVVVVRAGAAPPPGLGVASAEARPPRWSPAGELVVRTTGAAQAPVAVVLGDASGREVARVRATAEPGTVLRLPVRPDARGWLTGTVSVPPDEWRGDDRRHVALLVGDPPAVRADASAGPFAATALATLAASGRVRAAAGDAVAITAASAATRLPAVLVAPADGAGLAPANRALERLGIPWRFGALVTAPARARLVPLAAGDSVAQVEVARRWRLLPRGTAASDTLAAIGAEPWAVAGPGYVLLASPLDPAWTALPVRAAFVPWLGALASRRLQPEGDVRATVPGARVVPPAGVTALRAPDGRTSAVAVGQPLSVPPVLGVYLWLRDASPVGALVVDPDVEELDVARLSEGALRARVRGGAGRNAGEVTVTADGGAAGARAFRGGGRRPIGGFLVGAALLALAAEGLATRAGRRRGAAVPAAA